jgi:nucleoside-diphosphate-sugar epimerase
MKVIVADGGGVMGVHLIPQLAQQGHEVVAMTRTVADGDA